MSRIFRLSADELQPRLAALLTSQSLLASPAFLNCWSTLGGSPVFWVYEDQESVTILPGIETGFGPLKRFMSLGDGLYSRAFTFRGEQIEEPETGTMSRLLGAVAEAGYAKVWIYDFYQLFSNQAGFEVQPCETSLVDISVLDWEPPDATIRSEIRKAEREGIVVERFDRKKHLESFLVLMRQTEERHGRKPKYSDEFFSSLAELAEHEKRILWKHCTSEERAAASHIFLIEGEMALHWQVYFDKQFSSLKPNQYILARTVEKLRERGIATLNLGASPPEADGLTSYKEKWGGKSRQYNAYIRTSALGSLL